MITWGENIESLRYYPRLPLLRYDLDHYSLDRIRTGWRAALCLSGPNPRHLAGYCLSFKSTIPKRYSANIFQEGKWENYTTLPLATREHECARP